MISLRKSSTGTVGTVHLEGKLGIEHCGELKKVLLQAMDDTKKVQINPEKLKTISLPCLQLLCSAHISATRRQRSLSLAGARSEVFERSLAEEGFETRTECEKALQRSCLWLER